jgi:hypothetical protein
MDSDVANASVLFVVECGDAGEHLAFEKLEACSATGGDMGDLVGDAGVVDGSD